MTYRIGQISELTGVSVWRLQHWRRSRLVVPSAASASGRHTRYTERDVVRVRVVLTMLGEGRSMADIWRQLDTRTALAFHAEQSSKVPGLLCGAT